MFKKIINTGVLVSVALLFACKDHADIAIPPGVLGREEFTHLLVDLALAESAGGMNVKNVPIPKMDSAYAFNPLKENKVSQAQYDSTLSFYTHHTELYQEVYQLVLAELNSLQTRRDSLKTITVEKAKRDSLARISKKDSLDKALKKDTVKNKLPKIHRASK